MAKNAGIRGYSKMIKAQLEAVLELSPSLGDSPAPASSVSSSVDQVYDRVSDYKHLQIYDADHARDLWFARRSNIIPNYDIFVQDDFLLESESEYLFHRLNNDALYDARAAHQFRGRNRPRDIAFFSDFYPNPNDDPNDPDYPVYRHEYNRIPPPPHPFDDIPALALVRDRINSLISDEKQKVNHVVVHRYLDGKDNIQSHSDKTGDFSDGSSVWTVSLGEMREIRYHEVKPDGGSYTKTQANYIRPLPSGSLNQLDPRTNADYVHGVFKTAPSKYKTTKSRISLSFRSVKSRRSDSP